MDEADARLSPQKGWDAAIRRRLESKCRRICGGFWMSFSRRKTVGSITRPSNCVSEPSPRRSVKTIPSSGPTCSSGWPTPCRKIHRKSVGRTWNGPSNTSDRRFRCGLVTHSPKSGPSANAIWRTATTIASSEREPTISKEPLSITCARRRFTRRKPSLKSGPWSKAILDEPTCNALVGSVGRIWSGLSLAATER